MKNMYKSCLLIVLFLVGCGAPKKEQESPHIGDDAVVSVEHKPATIATQRIALPSLTQLLTGKQKKLDPVVTDQFILCFEEGGILFLDHETNVALKKLVGFTVQVQPVVLDDRILLVTTEHGLVVLNLSTLEILQEKKLVAPLLAPPLVLDNGDIFVQYIHNIAELLDNNFTPRWSISLPSISQYYQLSAYTPCADKHALYLSFPGGGLISLDRKTGLTRWNYRGFVETNALQHHSLGEKQVSAPLVLFDDLLVAKVSDGVIHLINKDTGIGLSLLEASSESPLLADDRVIYYVDKKGALVCYDIVDKQQLWVNHTFEAMPILSMRENSKKHLLINGHLPHLYILDKEDGALIQHYVHQFHQARLLSTQDNDTIYGIDKFGVFFKLLPENLT
jgi:hypothetical protein